MPKGISETAFASQVEDLLKLFGWRWCHFRPAWSKKGYRTPLTGDKGLPDYIAVRPPRLLFAELKDQYSKPTPEQEAWLTDLRDCQRTILNEPLAVKGSEAVLPYGLHLLGVSLNIEVYLWRPSQFDEIKECLR